MLKSKMKTRCFTVAIICMISILLSSLSVSVYADTFDNGKMWYAIPATNSFNIKGYYNGSLYRTTYNDNGYTTTLYVNGSASTAIFSGNGGTVNYNGVQLGLTITPVSGGNYLKLEYSATNTDSLAKTISIATDADTQIGTNDRATISELSGNRGFYMTDGAAQFMFIGRNSYGVTDVDYYWYGQYSQRGDNRFSQSSGTLSDIDSGMAFSWYNRTLAAGETKKYSVLIGIGALNNPPTLNLTSSFKNTYHIGDTVNIAGNVNDPDSGDVVSIKYALDNGTEYTIPQTYIPNGTVRAFSTQFTIPKTSIGNHVLQVWAVDDKGNMSSPVSANINVSDNTPPSIDITGNVNSWTNGDVTLKVTASDAESGLRSITLPDGTVINNSSATFTVTNNGNYVFKALDNAGNFGTRTVIVDKIDKIKPDVNITESDTHMVDSLDIICSATDEGSGVKSITLPDRTVVNNSTASYHVTKNGIYTFTVEDNVGNITTQTIDTKNIKEITMSIGEMEYINQHQNPKDSDPLVVRIPITVTSNFKWKLKANALSSMIGVNNSIEAYNAYLSVEKQDSMVQLENDTILLTDQEPGQNEKYYVDMYMSKSWLIAPGTYNLPIKFTAY